MVRKMLVGAMVLIGFAAAPAAAQYNFTVTPGTVAPGGQLTVAGGSCNANAEVTITMTQVSTTRAVGDVVFEETVLADGDGNFELTFTVPSDVEDGRYEVAAFCDGTQVANAFVEVTSSGPGPGPDPEGDGDGDGVIVRTGSNLNGLGLAGAGLLAAGGLVLIATKARRHQAAS